MSERYETQLVDTGETTYEQGALGLIAGSFGAFVLAVGTFFGWVPLADPVAGVEAARYFGAGLIGLGAMTAGLGAVSRWGAQQTTPDRSAGLAVGLLHAFVWTLTVGLVAGNTFGLGRPGWLIALPVGLGVGYATLRQREDIGVTFPTAVLVTLLGGLFLIGVISPAWTWTPDGFTGTIPGTLVVPLLTIFGSLLTGWAGAVAYEGFGTRGRQSGAFVLISLVVLLTLSVLVFLLVFVFERGIMVVLENLRLSAGTVLLLVSTTLFVLLRRTTINPATADGTDKIIAFVNLAATVVLALLGVVFLGAIATDWTVTGYSVTVEPTAVIGAVMGLLVAGLLLFTRESTAWQPVRDTGRLLGRGVRLLRRTTINPVTADGTDKIIAFVNLAATVVLALLGVVFLGTVATGSTVMGYSVTVGPTAVIGAVMGLLVAGFVFPIRESTAWQPETDAGRLLGRGIGLALVASAAVVVVELVVGVELAVAGIGAITVLLGAVALTVLVLAGVRVTKDRRGEPSASVPSAAWLGQIGLLAVLIACFRVFLTGNPVGTSQIGVVANGTVDWPFIMNVSQGLGIQRGVMPAMFGTIWIVLGAVVFAVPLAVGSAVYLTEYAEDSMFTNAVDIATNGLWSTPSIVFGLFGLAFLVPRLGGSPSILASQLVLGFMLLPLVLITSREAMKSVPDDYRDASAALGVSKWQTVRSVVIPAAMPGVITGVILGVGRIAGETAPLLLVLNGPVLPNSGPSVLSGFMVQITGSPPFVHVSNEVLLEQTSALPYQLYAIIKAGVAGKESFGWGTALVLLGVVLGFFAMSIATRRYFRRKLQQ
jgi:phosphate transport system permease protein